MSKIKVLTPPKNILISHVYSSDNKGDAALTSVLIDDLKKKFPNAALRILKLDAVTGDGKFEGVPEQPAFMQYALEKFHNPLLKLAYVLYMIPVTLLWAVWFRRTGKRLYLPAELLSVANAYAESDLIVAVGGGYIRSRRGLLNRLNIPLLLHPLLFGSLLGKPTVLYPQSVGPFMSASEKPLVAFVLRRMALVILRENTSVELLARMGVFRNVVRSIDSGFLLESKQKIDIRKKYDIPVKKLVVGVTVRSWLRGEEQTRYEAAVAEALDAVVEQFDAHILFIPQVTASKGDDDREVSRRVHSLMAQPTAATTIDEKLDHFQIKSIYDGLDVLLGTRFHSVIFSLTSHVPVLAIEYEHKTSGIMQDLGLEEWVIKIEDVVAAKLVALMQNLISQRKQYRKLLQKRLPDYVDEARQTVDVLEASYYRVAKDMQD